MYRVRIIKINWDSYMNNKLIYLWKNHQYINIFIKFLNERILKHCLYSFFMYVPIQIV